MTPAKKTFQPLTSSDVCAIYGLLHSNGLVSFPLTPEGRHAVEALVANITSSYFGVELYPSRQEKAAAYLYFIIKDHPFVDGNKRTACLTFETVAFINGLEPAYKGFTLDELVVFLEQHRDVDYRTVIKRVALLLFGTIGES